MIRGCILRLDLLSTGAQLVERVLHVPATLGVEQRKVLETAIRAAVAAFYLSSLLSCYERKKALY